MYEINVGQEFQALSLSLFWKFLSVRRDAKYDASAVDDRKGYEHQTIFA